MERLAINTGLNDFVLIDTISRIDAEQISGIKSFSRAPLFLGVESHVQIAAMHVRHITDFKRMAFLLKVKQFSATNHVLDGPYILSGILLSQGSDAYSYELKAENNDEEIFSSELIIGTASYGHDSKYDLEAYYKKVLSCLQNA